MIHINTGAAEAKAGFRRPLPSSGYEYFQQMLADCGAAWRDRARRQGRKLVGYFCTLLPEELLIAAGAAPVRLCSGQPVGESRLARDVCPVVGSAWELLSGGLAGELDAIVIPTTCDWKTKLSGLLAERQNVFVVSTPHIRRAEQVIDEWEALGEWLTEVTDVPITEKRLADALQQVGRAQTALRQLFELRKTSPPHLPGGDAMRIADAAFYGDTLGWIEACEDVVRELGAGGPGISMAGRPRLLLTGSPVIWPSYKLPDILEESGADIVCEDFCSRLNVLYESQVEPGSRREMLDGLARRAIEGCGCTFCSPMVSRWDLLRRAAEDFGAHGIVYHTLKGCAPAAMQARVLRDVSARAGLPLLEIETDYGRQDVEPLRTRVETFVSLIRP